jgi:hypothetical protein
MAQSIELLEGGDAGLDSPQAQNQMMMDSMQSKPQESNVSIYELDDEALIHRVKHMLAGEIFNPETGRWDKMGGIAPPMNDKGVHHFMIKFGGHLDKNIKLSHFKIEKIGEMMIDVCNDICQIFWHRGDEFEINPENMTFIMHILEHQIYANYMRALEGNEMTHRETVIRSVENIRDVQNTNTRDHNNGNVFGNIFKKNKVGSILSGGQ